MEFNATIQKSNRVKHFLLLMKKKHLANNKGIIPVVILVILGGLALLGVGFYLGKGNSFYVGIGVGIGLIIILPNLNRIIRWFKSIKEEVKK